VDGTTPAGRDGTGHRELPQPVRIEETITTHDTSHVPDPAMGRDAETEWLLRNAAG